MISIHAPTWGATRPKSYFFPDKFISIHAPTWGATHTVFNSSCQIGNFNPRTHVGCDRELCDIHHVSDHFNPRTHVGCDVGLLVVIVTLAISIHAPTWGATFGHPAGG